MGEKNLWVISKSMAAREHGLPVQIDGKDYYGGYNRIRSMVKEDADYMSDYEYDEQGKIVALYFDKLKRIK